MGLLAAILTRKMQRWSVRELAGSNLWGWTLAATVAGSCAIVAGGIFNDFDWYFFVDADVGYLGLFFGFDANVQFEVDGFWDAVACAVLVVAAVLLAIIAHMLAKGYRQDAVAGAIDVLTSAAKQVALAEPIASRQLFLTVVLFYGFLYLATAQPLPLGGLRSLLLFLGYHLLISRRAAVAALVE